MGEGSDMKVSILFTQVDAVLYVTLQIGKEHGPALALRERRVLIAFAPAGLIQGHLRFAFDGLQRGRHGRVILHLPRFPVKLNFLIRQCRERMEWSIAVSLESPCHRLQRRLELSFRSIGEIFVDVFRVRDCFKDLRLRCANVLCDRESILES